MKYEIRDYKTNNYLFGTFRKYEDAVYCVDELLDDDELEEDDFEIVQVLSNDDKDKLGNNLINQLIYGMSKQEKYKVYESGYRICDVNVIEAYSINEFFIKLLIVDKFHSIMLLSYSVISNDYLKIIEYEQIRKDYLS